jgi:hypothetical protein
MEATEVTTEISKMETKEAAAEAREEIPTSRMAKSKGTGEVTTVDNRGGEVRDGASGAAEDSGDSAEAVQEVNGGFGRDAERRGQKGVTRHAVACRGPEAGYSWEQQTAE